MAVNFPNSPTLNQTFTSGAQVYRYDGTKWVAEYTIADGSITSAKILDGTIATADIANLAITTAKIADSAVTAIKIADGTITPTELSTGRPFWDTSGNVGIGTNSPTNHLTIYDNDPGASANPLTLELYRDSASPATGDEWGRIAFTGRNASNTKFVAASIVGGGSLNSNDNNGYIKFRLSTDGATENTATAGLAFNPWGVWWDNSAGGIYLGYAPATGVSGGCGAEWYSVTAGSGGGYLNMMKARGTGGSETFCASGDTIGVIGFYIWNGTAWSSGATIGAFASNAHTTGELSSHLRFQTRVANTISERARFEGTQGYLLVGYTVSNGAYRLQVNSQIFATSGTIATSDGRYKENIQSLDGALDLVTQLNPVQFEWKEHPFHNFDREQPTVGFIAQEVQEVLRDKPYLNAIVKRNVAEIPAEYEQVVVEPEQAAVYSEDGRMITPPKEAVIENGALIKEAYTEEFYGIAESNLIALLTKAIQELKAEFDAYKETHP